jgi:hypothetical protein
MRAPVAVSSIPNGIPMVTLAAILLVVGSARVALADDHPATTGTPAPASPQTLGLFAGAGYLGSPGLSGGVADLGLRYAPLSHLALSFDLGYGVIGGSASTQDRWWLMPAAALVVPVGPATLDVGAGLGLGATSGYSSGSAYVAAPFTPVWAFQLVPAVRGHAMVTLSLGARLDGFARLEVASLLLGGNSIGSRVDNPHPEAADTLWYDLVLGVHFHLL